MIETNSSKSMEKEIKMFEGTSGIKDAFNDILNTMKNTKEKEYFVFTLGEELGRKNLVEFFLDYHKKRIKDNIKVKLIANENLRNVFSKYYLLRKMETRHTIHNLPTGVFIYSNKVMTIVWEGKPIALVITSDSYARRYRKFFDEMWEKAGFLEEMHRKMRKF